MRTMGETFKTSGRTVFLVLLMTGVFSAGLIALDGANNLVRAADGPCFDNTGRWVDCGNGTVTDSVTGLIWLKDGNCLRQPPKNSVGWTYSEANNAAAILKNGDCGLTDKSAPGDWRLPTLEEWTATIEQAVAMKCTYPSLTDVTGKACFNPDGNKRSKNATGAQPFQYPRLDYYWTRSTDPTKPDAAWLVAFAYGRMYIDYKNNSFYGAWPVRDGK